MPPPADALATLDQAISRAGGAKVMLRMDEAVLIRAVLRGEPPVVCGLIDEGRPCACMMRDPACAHRRGA